MHSIDDTEARDPGFASFWGHPRPVWMLFGVTIGLNFAFYGFRAYLAPYIEHFFVAMGPAAAQKQADLVSSGFLALMYATPIIGGYVADKILGETRALIMALWLGVIGLVLMALPSLIGFEIGMALFALSAGLGIPLTVLIGRTYGPGDPRRAGGYTIFYLAINLGAFITPFICADWIGKNYGYHWGFIAAAVGMLVAALIFQAYHRILRPALPRGDHLHGRMATVWVLAVIAVLLYPTALLLSFPKILSWSMYGLMILLVLYFVVSCVRRGDRVQAQRYIALFLLFVPYVVFWAFSLQGVTSLNFLARDHVTPIWHGVLPMLHLSWSYTLFQSANPLFILIFAPLMAMLWPWLDRKGRDPSTPRKFGIGLLLVALGYGVLVLAIHYLQGPNGHISWWPLALCYLLATLGELALSPIGYSLVGQLAAPEEASLAMGGWFFGVALAYQLGGWIATLTTSGAGASALPTVAGYGHVYALLFWWGLAVAAVFLLAAPWIKRLMHGIR
ncbi:MAG: oligopeptide:H+ symporter [Gammaproteobacteria bacterium]